MSESASIPNPIPNPFPMHRPTAGGRDGRRLPDSVLAAAERPRSPSSAGGTRALLRRTVGQPPAAVDSLSFARPPPLHPPALGNPGRRRCAPSPPDFRRGGISSRVPRRLCPGVSRIRQPRPNRSRSRSRSRIRSRRTVTRSRMPPPVLGASIPAPSIVPGGRAAEHREGRIEADVPSSHFSRPAAPGSRRIWKSVEVAITEPGRQSSCSRSGQQEGRRRPSSAAAAVPVFFERRAARATLGRSRR